MKNIHILPTDKPSRLSKSIKTGLALCKKEAGMYDNSVASITPQHIYITNSEEIKDGYYLDLTHNIIMKSIFYNSSDKNCKKIILTTDQDLIKDSVQAINDEFLEWFVENPSCEKVDVEKDEYFESIEYDIIIPKEELKQFFTDYPITELGDEEFKEAPIRQCKLISYDNNKYCYVKVEGIEKEIKRAYIYTKPGRCGEVDCISIDEIKELMKEEPKQETLEEVGMYQQELFNYLHDLGVTALQSEMQEIERIVLGMQNINALHFEIDALKREIKVFKHQQEQDKNKFSEEDLISLLEFNYKKETNQLGTLRKDYSQKIVREWFKQFKNK